VEIYNLVLKFENDVFPFFL